MEAALPLQEGAVCEAGVPSLARSKLLPPLAVVVAKHGCWAMLGTMTELCAEKVGAARQTRANFDSCAYSIDAP
jgi:hypothetical protein